MSKPRAARAGESPAPSATGPRRVFTFVVEARLTMHVDVAAASLEEAVRRARAAGTMTLCHECARGERGCWSLGGELDAEPGSSGLVEVVDNGSGGSVLQEALALW